MPVLAAWCGGHCRSDGHGPACEKERWGKRLGMRRDSGQKRLARGLDADRVSSGDCAEDGAGGLGSPCNVGAGRGPPEKMGQETRKVLGLGPDEVSPGLGCGPCELRGLRGRWGWRTWFTMQRWSRQGPTRKMGQETRNALGLGPDEVSPGLGCGPTEPRGPFGDSAGVASGQTPKKPEEQTASRRESDQEAKGAGGPGQWVTGARVRSWARNQRRRNGRRGDWRQGPLGPRSAV